MNETPPPPPPAVAAPPATEAPAHVAPRAVARQASSSVARLRALEAQVREQQARNFAQGWPYRQQIAAMDMERRAPREQHAHRTSPQRFVEGWQYRRRDKHACDEAPRKVHRVHVDGVRGAPEPLGRLPRAARLRGGHARRDGRRVSKRIERQT